MNASHRSRPTRRQQDRSWSPSPPPKEPNGGAAQEETPQESFEDQPTEAEQDSNDALMETYNG